MERYFGTFKNELICNFEFDTDEKLEAAINDYVFCWYNYLRPHSFNDGASPFEKRFS